METERLVVEIDANLKKSLTSYCKLNGQTAKYVITKLLYEFLKGQKNGRQTKRTQRPQTAQIRA